MTTSKKTSRHTGEDGSSGVEARHLASVLRQRPAKQANCAAHGPYTSRNIMADIWTKCPVCANEAASKAKVDSERAEKQARVSRWAERLGHACIPSRFQDRTLDNFHAETVEQHSALRLATGYAEEFSGGAMLSGRSLVFVGGPGTGKTHLACAIALRIMGRAGHSALFMTVYDAMRHIKSTWGGNSKLSELQAVANLVEPDLLILDEVGQQYGSEAERQILFDVLNKRYEARRPCILLSNLDMKDVVAFLGERVIDRLAEDGAAFVAFKWESHRRGKK